MTEVPSPAAGQGSDAPAGGSVVCASAAVPSASVPPAIAARMSLDSFNCPRPHDQKRRSFAQYPAQKEGLN